MRIFNKFVLICNICCIAAAILRYVEMSNKAAGTHAGNLIPLPWLQNSIVILGYGAIIVNTIFVLCYALGYAARRKKLAPVFVTGFNVAMLPLQVVYFFFLK